jgi:hypothetical protein
LRKFLLFVILIAGVAVLYSIFSDPARREKFLGTIEGSTGVDLNAVPEDLIEDAGRAVGNAAEKMLKDLGDTLSDPAFHRSVERWGKDVLENLDDSQLKNLQKDLEREAEGGGEDFDGIFQEYLGKTGDS